MSGLSATGKEEVIDMEGKKNNVFRNIILIFVMAAGITCLVFGIRNISERKAKEKYFLSERGIVSDVIIHKSERKSSGKNVRNSSITYSGVYTYMVNGIEYTIKDSVSTSTKPTIGAKVEIRYNPDNPEDAFVKGRVFLGHLLVFLGILFTIVPLAILILSSNLLSETANTYVSSFLFSVFFMSMGFGLLYVLKPGFTVVGILLSLFGLLGIYMFVYPFIDWIKKRGSGS